MRLPPEPLTSDEVAGLLAVCGRSSTGVRNRALILTLYGAGLRIGEALALTPRDMGERRLSVRHGKGDVSRIVSCPDDLVVALDHWMTVRDALGGSGRQPVFCQITTGRVGLPIDQAYIRALFPRLGRKAGIEKRVHAHGLRHSHALRLVQAGANIVDVRDQLGHASVAVTDRYLRRVAPEARLERVRSMLNT